MKTGTVSTSYTRPVFGMRAVFQILEDAIIGGKLFKKIQIDFADGGTAINHYPASKFTDLRSYGDWFAEIPTSVEETHETLMLIEVMGKEKYQNFCSTLQHLQDAYWAEYPCEISKLILRRVYKEIRP